MMGEQAMRKLNRSELAVPCTRPEFFAKAARSAADAIFLDLEDAVAPSAKEEARGLAIRAIRDNEWGSKFLSVRVNGPDTPLLYQDVIQVVENAGPRLDALMIPKTSSPRDVHMVELLLDQIEARTGRERPIALELLIETAAGVMNVDDILACSQRVVSVHFGCGDFAASLGSASTSIGAGLENYGTLAPASSPDASRYHPMDAWHYPMMRVLIAARARGVRAIDGPYGNFSDLREFGAAARRAAALGFDGKWAIHPTQIEALNAIFLPGEDQVARARAVLHRVESANAAGAGAVAHDGELVDIASIRQALSLLEKVELANGI